MEKAHIRLHYTKDGRWWARTFYPENTRATTSITERGTDEFVLSELKTEFRRLGFPWSPERLAIFEVIDGETYMSRIGAKPKRQL